MTGWTREASGGPGQPGVDQLESDPRWQVASTIATSSLFIRSPRLSQLLLFLAAESIQGRSHELSEHVIAARLFARNNFDPASDTIVRSHLLRLRQRLQQYELEEHAPSEQFQITIPRGQYAVDFQQRISSTQPAGLEPPQEETVDPAPVEIPFEPKQTLRRRSLRQALTASLAALVLVLGVITILALGLSSNRWHRAPSPAAGPIEPLWRQLLSSDQSTLVVAADSSLVILHGIVRHDTTLADYLSGKYRNDPSLTRGVSAAMLGIAAKRYTSFVDLTLLEHMHEVAETHAASVQARFARDLSIDDLKRSNVILSGSRGANPWVELYEPQMNFIVWNDYVNGRAVVTNRHPASGEASAYYTHSEDHMLPLYGVLAFLPNLDPSHNVLLVEGTSLAGTEAVRDVLFNEAALGPFLKTARRKDGSLRHFEILLSSEAVNGKSSKVQILTSRIYD